MSDTQRPYGRTIALLILLAAAVPLLAAGISFAQEAIVSNESIEHAEAADLVIDDPQADLPSIIAEKLGLAATPASVVIPAADFSADRSPGSAYYLNFSGGYIYSNDTSYYCGAAPVYLPDGVTINAMTAFVYDNYESDNVWVNLVRKEYGSTLGSTTLASITTSDTSTALLAVIDTTISNALVDNTSYVYYLTTCFGDGNAGSNNRLYGVQVFFTS